MEKKILKTLFVVDDDADILILIKHCLDKLPNIQVKYLHSGESAIREACISPPDMMLVDVMMPQMDGLSVLKTVQSLPMLAHIPIVFFTAKVQQDEIAEYYKQGACNVITKPFDPRKLGSEILEIWDKNQSPPKKEEYPL